jgi:hypothetical protein
MADVHYVEVHGEKREVVAFCEEYVGILSRVVKDFIEKPPKPKAIGRHPRRLLRCADGL